MPKQPTAKLNPPMLAKVYNSTKHDWSHAWMVEPKFDGLRCNILHTINGSTPYSRNGKPLWNMLYPLSDVSNCKNVSPEMPDFVLDGEVYTTDWNLSMSIVKRSTKSHPDMDKLRFHVWDCLTLAEWKAGKSSVSNLDRKKRLCLYNDTQYVRPVEHIIARNHTELQNIYQKFLGEGYEGAILKDPKGIYECGRRSPSWLKVKPWHDADLTVVGSYPGEGKHTGRIGGLILEGETEWMGSVHQIRTEVGTGFTDEDRESFQKLSENGMLVGLVVEIKYQEITGDGSCRFPVFNRLREDK